MGEFNQFNNPMLSDFKKLRLKKIENKLRELESSLSPHPRASPSGSLSPAHRHCRQLPSFTMNNENELIQTSQFHTHSHNRKHPTEHSMQGISHRSISRRRNQSKSASKKTRSIQPGKSKGRHRDFLRDPHEEFFNRKKLFMSNRRKQQQEYEDRLKKQSERAKMSTNSKMLLERVKLRHLDEAIEKENREKLDFGCIGRVLDRVGCFEYLKLDQESTHHKYCDSFLSINHKENNSLFCLS